MNLRFESDGSPTTVRRIVRSSLVNEKRRAKQIEQLECRQKADAAKVLPRDRTGLLFLGVSKRRTARSRRRIE